MKHIHDCRRTQPINRSMGEEINPSRHPNLFISGIQRTEQGLGQAQCHQRLLAAQNTRTGKFCLVVSFPGSDMHNLNILVIS